MNTNYRPWMMKIRPFWLREKLYHKFYQKTEHKYSQLFEQAPLEFLPEIRLKLVPTDESHKHLAFTGFHEFGLTKRMLQFAYKGGLLIDVGANCGYFSCLWAGTNRNNKVIAFEPSPKIIDVLRLNISNNQLHSQIQIMDVAVGKENRHLPFALGADGQTDWGSLLSKAQGDSIEVSVVRLDDIIHESNYDYIDVLKIDTEGADTWVLQGAEKLLRKHRIRHIFYEKSMADMKKLGIDPLEAQKLLKSCGYTVKSICCGFSFKPLDTSLDLGEYYASAP